MKKVLTVVLGITILFSAQIFAEDDLCNVVLHENAGKNIKTGDVSYNGSLLYVNGKDALDGVVKDEVDMFQKVLAKHASYNKGLRSIPVTGMSPLPTRDVFDNKGQKKAQELQLIPFQTYKSEKGVALGNNSWVNIVTVTQDQNPDLVSMYYDVLVKSYSEKLNILAVDPKDFNKDKVVGSVKDALGKIKACEDAKDKVRKELAMLIGSAKDDIATYSAADQETLQSAIDIANNIHDKKAASLQELNKAKQDLTDVRAKLTPVVIVDNKNKKTEPNSNEQNPNESLPEFKDLKALIDHVTEQKSKFPASINGKLDPVINKAKTTLNDKNSTAAQLKDAHDKLDAAYKEALKELLNDLIAMIEGDLGNYSYDAQPALKEAIKVAKDYLADETNLDVTGLEKAIELLVKAKLAADMEAGKIPSSDITDEMIKNEWAAFVKKLDKDNPVPGKEKKFYTLEEVKKNVPGTEGNVNETNVKKGKWSTLDEVKQGVPGKQ